MRSPFKAKSPGNSGLRSEVHAAFSGEIADRVRSARIAAAKAVNRERILLCWDIGRSLAERESQLGSDDAFADSLARELRRAFPDSRGFAAADLRDMKDLYCAYTESEFLRHAAAELCEVLALNVPVPRGRIADLVLHQLISEVSWESHLTILRTVAEPRARVFFIQATARQGWTTKVLRRRIAARACEEARGDWRRFDLAPPSPDCFNPKGARAQLLKI